jgi:hypothetical protein
MNPTPRCPAKHYEFRCTLCDIDLVCHLEHFPAEKGSVDSYGAAYEPDIDESMFLVCVYLEGSDVDIVAIVSATYLDHLETLALADLKAYK